MDHVPLRVYGSVVEARLAKSLLEAHGIEAHADDMDLLQAGLGRVTLYVASSAVEEAKQLLGDDPRQDEDEDEDEVTAV